MPTCTTVVEDVISVCTTPASVVSNLRPTLTIFWRTCVPEPLIFITCNGQTWMPYGEYLQQVRASWHEDTRQLLSVWSGGYPASRAVLGLLTLRQRQPRLLLLSHGLLLLLRDVHKIAGTSAAAHLA